MTIKYKDQMFGQIEVDVTMNGKKVRGRRVILPMPPSENTRLVVNYDGVHDLMAHRFSGSKKTKRGTLRNSTKYNQWIAGASNLLKKGKLPMLEGDCTVLLTVVFPDNRVRDAQNREKALFDAFTASGCIYKDDFNIKLHATHKTVIEGHSFVIAMIFKYGECDALTIDEDYIKGVAQFFEGLEDNVN